MKTLYLLSGVQGSGKSTWAKEKLLSYEPKKAIWISRDVIRFRLLKDGEDYFAHESEVLNLFFESINSAIRNPNLEVIIVDASHLTNRSRNKTLRRLNLNPEMEIINVIFDVPFEVCKQRNASRTGRERVPEKVLEQAHKIFELPNNGYPTIMIKG